MAHMKEHVISKVDTGSIAAELGIGAGDVLLSVNGKEICDIFDYRLACQSEQITVLIRKKTTGETGKGAAEAEEWELDIEKDPYEDLGLTFESGLMDDYRSCCNGCVFCFIDQMPKGMRKTLYFKDDDARLSFLQGNYVTLTNMTDKEIDRILEYHLSPINVSFHTTNPELRNQMLRHPKAGEALEKAKRLAAEGTGIELNGQIVLCKGLNDGEELDRTMHDLLYDYAPGLKSVSVVPVGLTRHRKGLYPLEPFMPEEAVKVIRQIHAFQKEARRVCGTRFVYAGDEWYLLAREDLPPARAYDGYPQLENGVGMTRLLIDEFEEALAIVREEIERKQDEAGKSVKKRDAVLRQYDNEISFCTGKMIYPVLRRLLRKAHDLAPGVVAHLYPVRNDFFGEHITVSGLLTGGDIIRQLRGKPLGSCLYLPVNVLRAGEEVLLDDVTVSDIEKALGTRVAVSGHSGYDLVAALFDLPADYFDTYRTGGTPLTDVNPYELKDK